jgi:glycosyltransferase involved in cell wall biosynthesis
MVHNRYNSSSPSGENRVVDSLPSLLETAGVRVMTYLRSSDEIDEFSVAKKLSLGVRPFYSPEDVAAINGVIGRFQPDILHLHNPFPLISPAVINVAKHRGCAVVQSVHNYRHSCVAGTHFRGQNECEDCIGRSFGWPAILHGCYRGSRVQSAAMVAATAFHRRTWARVDRFLPVSGFVADHLSRLGVASDRITVVPNTVADPGPPKALGDGFLYAGRLSSEKGINLLLDAWEYSGIGKNVDLTIAGDGPERRAVERAAGCSRGVAYTGGVVSAEEVGKLVDACRAVVVPSLLSEAFGTIVLEAFARGRPVVATRGGALGSLVDDNVGWLAPGEVEALSSLLRKAHIGPTATLKGRQARRRYEECFAPKVVLSVLLECYQAVLDRR